MQDYDEAAKWYYKSAEQGEVYAQVSLGLFYETGKGVAQDYVEAAKWYRKAAVQGDSSAQYNLAILYGKGQGVLQDYIASHAWLNISARNGSESAMEKRNALSTYLNPFQLQQAQALAKRCLESEYRDCP